MFHGGFDEGVVVHVEVVRDFGEGVEGATGGGEVVVGA